jgi:acetyl esterase/lipase
MAKVKTLMHTIILAILFTWNIFAQAQSFEELTFVYKIVEGHEIKANIFLPENNFNHAVFVYFHGGGFIFGNRDEGLETILRDKLLAHGYAVVSADYRLAPETKLDGIVEDARDIVLWIRENGSKQFKIDENKIVVAGGSAGGYLAISAGYTVHPAPNAVIAISSPTGFTGINVQEGDRSILKQPGPYDIVKDSAISYGDYTTRVDLWRFLAKNSLSLYEIFGFDVAKDTARLQNFTLTKNIHIGYPPTLIVHAKNDQLVDYSEAQNFYNFLQEKKIASELFTVENGHSSVLINNSPEAVEKIIQFLDVHLNAGTKK